MKVEIYTIDHCPYCIKAKAILTDRKISFEEIHVDRGDTEKVQALMKRSGMRTFPQIFANGKLVGGCSELEVVDKKGPLAELLAAM